MKYRTDSRAAGALLRVVALAAMMGGALGWASCGVYSVSSGRLDPSLRRVAVPFLENRSPEPNIEVELTDLMVRALQDDNTLKVTDERGADTILTGAVVRYHLQEAFTRPDLQVDEYQVQIVVELSLTAKATGKALFENKRLTGSGNFILNDPQGSSEATARAEAAAEIVRELVALVVEDW